MSDESGRLVFREGLLVQAVRRGHWIVLDELNLAPTEVLEALNRCAGIHVYRKGAAGSGQDCCMLLDGQPTASWLCPPTT